MMIGNIAAGNIAIRYGCKGPSLPVVTACATSTNTIGEAFHAIRYGYADAILAGGSEATVNALAIGGFANCKALTEATDPEAASLPFDRRRAGFVLGEGAAVVVLENYDHAVARGAHIYAEMCGYGNTCDAHHITAPDPEAEGGARAIRLAYEEAGSPEGLLYINATAPARRSTILPKRWLSKRRWARKRPAPHGQLHQVDDRPHAGRGGRVRVRRLRAGACARHHFPHHPSGGAGSRLRSGLRAGSGARGAG